MSVMDPPSPLEEPQGMGPYLCIAVEGRMTQDDRFLEPGAVDWQFDTRIPLRVLPVGSPPEHGHLGAVPIGSVQVDWIMKPEGLVMAYLYPESGKMPEGPFALGLDLDQLGFVDNAGLMRVTHARLRAVTILPGGRGVWPEVQYERI